jgi:hypothetical protein
MRQFLYTTAIQWFNRGWNGRGCIIWLGICGRSFTETGSCLVWDKNGRKSTSGDGTTPMCSA